MQHDLPKPGAAEQLSRLLNPYCLLCLEPLRAHEYQLCTLCREALPHLSQFCYQCALPLPGAAANSLCGRCQVAPPSFDYCVAALQYTAPVDRLISGFKYQARFEYGDLLARLLAQQIHHNSLMHSPPDCIVPVPLHLRRLLSRGYNQSIVFAKSLRKHYRKLSRTQLSIDVHGTRRTRYAPPQSQQTMREREHNIQGVFAVRHSARLPQRVAIVDDVMTTGATANELAQVLKRAGVQEVTVWVAARTPLE